MTLRERLQLVSVFLFILLLRIGQSKKNGFDPGGLPQSEFVIEKDRRSPWSQLTVTLPANRGDFEQFIAKVVDTTERIPPSLHDVNRTFLASVEDASVIKVHNLHPGHQYSITIIGRSADSSEKIKSEEITMDPQAPEIIPDKDIVVHENNATMHARKTNKAVQTMFRVTYEQISPSQKFPPLEVVDIAENQDLEFYIGHLNPGREYKIRVVAERDELTSRPWETKITTKPAPPESLLISDSPPNCVKLDWQPPDSGIDGFEVEYASKQSDSAHKMTLTSVSSATICDGIQPGRRFRFNMVSKKGHLTSTAVSVVHNVRPMAPVELKVARALSSEHLQVEPDLTKGKYRIEAELSALSFSERCHLSVMSDSLSKSEVESSLDGTAHVCLFYLPLAPGDRYEFSVSSSASGVSSAKMSRGLGLAPAFDMKAFGLNVQETRAGLELQWPQSEVFLSRLKDIWAKIVGRESHLELRISSLDSGHAKDKKKEYQSDPSDSKPITVMGLRRGACYQVQIYTVTRTGITSVNKYNENLRMAAPSVQLTLETVTHTTAALQINASLVDQYHGEANPDCHLSITVNDMHQMVVFERRLQLSKNMANIDLTGLRPYHKYGVNSQVMCGTATANHCAPSTRVLRSISFSTRQDRPGPVQALQVKPLNPYSAQLSWLPPALPNGILTHYVIGVQPIHAAQDAWSVNVALSNKKPDHTVEAVIDNLIGGESYRFEVRAVTEAGSGDSTAANDQATLTMPIMAPPKPMSTLDVVVDSITPSTTTLRYTTQMFDSKNGRITKSSVIVAEVTADGRVSETWLYAENKTYTWAEVQRFDVWPAYTATSNEVPVTKPSAQVRTITEVIGANSNCRDLPADVVCNGPLKPGTAYKFRLRLFTAPNLWTDSDFSPVITTEAAAAGFSSRLLVLALCVLVALGLCSGVCLALWNRSKSKRNPSFNANSKEGQWAALKMIMAERAADCLAKLGLDSSPATQCTSSASPTQPAGQHLQQPVFGHHRRCRSLRERTGVDHRLERLPSGPALFRTPIYTVMPGTNTNKKIQDFAEHFRLMSADSDFRFSEEYEQLKNVGVGQSISAAEMPVNRVKNRFTNILPYDHSRVKLIRTGEEDGADYINANYMPGVNSRREFIAAQGPLPSTRDHFWQMVWEQQCPAIIALTKCVEKGRDKCHQYWPDAEHMSVLYGDVEVTLMSEQQYDEFIVRELRLCHFREQTPPRHVLHLHYMAWPDFGVPDHPQGIVSLARLFRMRLPHCAHNKPTIVHCSAGVGRSGTFMALDRLVKQMAADIPIDVFGTVYEMRLERCHMVQNEQQYIFIHQCLLFVLQSGILPEWSQPPPPSVVTVSGEYLNGSQTGPPRVEIHQNAAFDDDEGIAESGF